MESFKYILFQHCKKLVIHRLCFISRKTDCCVFQQANKCFAHRSLVETHIFSLFQHFCIIFHFLLQKKEKLYLKNKKERKHTALIYDKKW
jgi:hypothetical protein